MNERNAFRTVRIVTPRPHKVAGPPHPAPTESIDLPRPLSEEGLRRWYDENRLAGAAYVRVLTNTLAARYGAWVDSQGQVRALDAQSSEVTSPSC